MDECPGSEALLTSDSTAPVESVQALFAHYPGIEDKVTIQEFMKARQEASEERFKRVEPMVGAAKLVRHLVRHSFSSSLFSWGTNLQCSSWGDLISRDNADVAFKFNAGVPIAIATGSSMESFIWKTVR